MDPDLGIFIGIRFEINKTGFESKPDSELEPLFRNGSKSRCSMLPTRNPFVCNPSNGIGVIGSWPDSTKIEILVDLDWVWAGMGLGLKDLVV